MSWDHLLSRAEFAFNSSVNRTTGHASFEIVYGQMPRRPLDLTPLAHHHDRIAEDGLAFAQHIRDFHRIMHDRIASTYESYKRDADVRRRPVHYTKGDLVMVRLRPERYSLGVATKLHPPSVGPFSDNQGRRRKRVRCRNSLQLGDQSHVQRVRLSTVPLPIFFVSLKAVPF